MFTNNIHSHIALRCLIIFSAASFIFTAGICAAEEDTEDLFASVVVLPTFDISIDNNYINFGRVEPGKSITLKEATHYNTLKCVSNKGRDYSVKIHILDDIIGPKGNIIPASSFKWRIYKTTGTGSAVSGWQEFSKNPLLVYASSREDNTGKELVINFQYKLDLPLNATGGHYALKVVYMITEE
jgi:hypothetical protein